MTITITTKQLLSVLKSANAAVLKKSPLPILSDFKIQAIKDKGLLYVTGGNQEFQIIKKCEADVSEDKTFCVNAENILQAIDLIKDEKVVLELEEPATIRVKHSKGELSYPFESANVYPSIETGEMGEPIFLDEDILKHLINKTSRFVASDELRPVMNGIFVGLGNEGENKIVAVASDGHKLVKALATVEGITASQDLTFILPPKPAIAIVKELSDNPENKAKIKVSQRSCEIQTKSALFRFRLIEGRFPNYNSVIPQGHPNSIMVEKESLLESLKRMSITANQASGLVKFACKRDILTPIIELTSCDVDFGRNGRESLPAESVTGEDIVIGLKNEYFQMLITNLTSDRIRIETANASTAILIYGENGDDGITELLMPMMLND